jgi:hypothetical protein
LILIILYFPWKRRKRYAAKRIMKNRGVFEKKHKKCCIRGILPYRDIV